MNTTTKPRTVNGVPVDQLVETMRVIRKEPKVAKFTFRAKNAWQGGSHNRARSKEYYGACQEHDREKEYTFDMGEPPVLLGRDEGANPVEYLLAALSGCLTTSLVYHAAARGIEVQEVTSKYEGDLDLHGFLGMDDSIRNGYQQIRVTMSVKADAPDEILDELVQAAHERSPVFDTIRNPVDIRVQRAK